MISEYLHKVFEAVAKNGLPDGVLEQMKMSYQLDVNNVGLLDTVVELSESVATNGLEKMTAKIEAAGAVTQDHIKEIATKLLDPRAELTLYSSNIKGKENEVVERVNFSKELLDVRKELAPSVVTLDARVNKYLLQAQATMYGDVGKGDTTKIIVFPRTDNMQAEARIELGFADSLKPAERLALDLAMLEFRLSPAQAEMFSFLSEAHIEFSYSFDARDMKMTISMDGQSDKVAMAATEFLEAWRNHDPTAAGIIRAKTVMINALRDAPVGEVSGQAVSLGVNVVLGGRGRDLKKQIQDIAKSDIADSTKAMAIMRSRWGLKAIFGGNWDQEALNEVNRLIQPTHKEKLRTAEFKAELPALEKPTPELIVQKSEVARQGVARLYPLAVKAFTKEYWAMVMFSQIFDSHLSDIVRDEHKLAYAVQSGFSMMPEGGSLFYMFGDTSKASVKMALAYTIALSDALGQVPSELDFAKAKYDITQMIARNGSGLDGVYSREMEGIDWRESAKLVAALTREEVIEIVRPLIDSARKVDAVVTNDTSPYCSSMMTAKNAIDPAVQNFFKNVAPKFKKPNLSSVKR